MAMHFEELDDRTRKLMLEEFEIEQRSSNPYFSPLLTKIGRREFVSLMRKAIRSGDEQQLVSSLARATYWDDTNRRGSVVNVRHAAEQLAVSEFNTWYVRGLAKRLLDEGVTECQVYRAEDPRAERGECRQYEGRILPVEDVYGGHRARYWPEPGDPHALSVPFHPGCHHTIRRVAT